MDFKEIKRLQKLGFAIHWLKPKSKSPYPGWGKTRETLESLRKKYRKGMGVGTRLGSVSKIGEGYLAVIDLDVKSLEPHHRDEAEKKLKSLYPEVFAKAPKVDSGRGNGSGHYYVLTSEAKNFGSAIAKSTEIVKVKMPSIEPSNKERETLTAVELESGIRLRAAWEISILSEGRQVVLPGSFHPDTGAAYAWARPVHDLQFIEVEKAEALGALAPPNPSGAASAFSFIEVNPNALGLKPEQLKGLVQGDDVQDRSAFAFSLCMALLQRRHSRDTILSVLTDRSNWLGAVGFDHAKTNSRERAAQWVDKYCLRKATEQVSASLFETDPVEELGEWARALDRTAGGQGKAPQIKATFKNIRLILENEIGFDIVRRNLFSLVDTWSLDTPWGCSAGAKRSGGFEDAVLLKKWLVDEWGFEAAVSMIEEVLLHFAASNAFHPVKDFLESLEWDGRSRVRTAFREYLAVSTMPEPYLGDVCERFFIALIKRIYEPGAKFDHMPVFEGSQGIGKSSFGAILVGEEWYMDSLPPLADKDSAQNLLGIWLVEMAELAQLRKSELETAKAFITRQVDKFRPSYGRRRIDAPRQCVFLGTTNSKDYLTDPSGNRRFWPIEVGQVFFDRLKMDRLQLLAEAKFLYDFAIKPLWLTGKAEAQAKVIQASRLMESHDDILGDVLRAWCESPENKARLDGGMTARELFEDGPWVGTPWKWEYWTAAARELHALGYERKKSGGRKVWLKA